MEVKKRQTSPVSERINIMTNGCKNSRAQKHWQLSHISFVSLRVCVCARVYNYSNNIIFSSKTVEVEASTSTEVEGEAEMKHVRYD